MKRVIISLFVVSLFLGNCNRKTKSLKLSRENEISTSTVLSYTDSISFITNAQVFLLNEFIIRFNIGNYEDVNEALDTFSVWEYKLIESKGFSKLPIEKDIIFLKIRPRYEEFRVFDQMISRMNCTYIVAYTKSEDGKFMNPYRMKGFTNLDINYFFNDIYFGTLLELGYYKNKNEFASKSIEDYGLDVEGLNLECLIKKWRKGNRDYSSCHEICNDWNSSL